MLARLAHERMLCAFDFDGTLAPIAAHPDAARMRKRTRNLLRRVASLFPCIVVSGRSGADVQKKLSGVHVAVVMGNHGAEIDAAPALRRNVKRWKAALAPAVALLPGAWIEDKELSLAIHYRQCRPKAEVRRSLLAAAQRLKHARVFGGKQVVNVVGDMAANKGSVLAAERDRLKCNWVLYCGDDENDEDAFALEGNIVPVRIGRKQRTHASYYLRSQAEIDELLELLAGLRKKASN